MKIVQVYARASSHEDQIVADAYADVESAMGKIQTRYTALMGDINAKAGKKQEVDHAVADYEMGTRNNKGSY